MQDDDLAFLFLAALLARLDQLGPQTDDHSGKVTASKHEQGPFALLLSSFLPRFGLQLQFLQLLQYGLAFFLSRQGSFPRPRAGQRGAVDSVLRIGGRDPRRLEPLQGGSRTGGENIQVFSVNVLVRGGGGGEVLLAEETGQVCAAVVGFVGRRGRGFGIRRGRGFGTRDGLGKICGGGYSV